ncbi:MAG: hypothetical protein IJZ74_05055 [Clostridia bacterium]|nr:hypothetical protein [Clostridia bacterium]
MPVIRPRTKDRKVRRIRMRALMTALVLAAGTMTVLGADPPVPQVIAEGEAPMKTRWGRTVMYVMDEAGLDLRASDADKLDQLNYSFALIKNGKADGSHWMGIRKAEAFLKKHPHIDGVLSVGGWGAEGFSDACATEEGRRALADSILALMDKHGFHGVDIDWEYPGISGNGIKSRPEDVENWYALLALLREGLDQRETLHGREYILSVALGAGDSHMKVIDPERLDALLDQAVVMAYDLSGFDKQTGHHAGLYPGSNKANTGARAVQALVDSGLSRSKILLGIPAYGRVWRQVSGGGDGLAQRAGTSGNKTVGFDHVLRLTDDGYVCHYDEDAQAAYWFDGSSFVSAEDDRSIAFKCSWLIEQGLQGTAVWSYNQDASGAMLAMLDAALR